MLYHIILYGVNVPFWDQWDFVREMRLVDAGQTSYPRLFFLAQGEHQIGVQVLLSALAWQITGMYMPALMVLNWAAAAGFCLLALLVTRRALPPGSSIPWTVLGAACLFVFNPAAYQVWLWGLPLVHLLVPLFFLKGVFVAQSRAPDGAKLLTAGLLALLASFTLTSGLLLWALFPLVLRGYLKPGAWRRERLALALCGALLLVSSIPYGAGILSHHSPAPAAPFSLVTLARFFLAYTGNLVGLATSYTPVTMAELAGFALVVFFLAAATLAVRQRRGERVVVIWAALGAYSLAAGVLVALGRYGFGVAYAVESSRYVLASSFLPIACVALGCLLIDALVPRLPATLHLYSWTLVGTAALILAAGAFRLFQYGPALALMRHMQSWELTGKVAALSLNLVELPEYRHIYSTDHPADFKLSANFLNRKGWLQPPLWDGTFVRELASPERRAEPAFGRVEVFSRAGNGVQLAGSAPGAHAVIVLGREAEGARILAVVIPSGERWTAEVPWTGQVRCFAYDAVSGQAHLLAGGQQP
jgi:hypothetical protein